MDLLFAMIERLTPRLLAGDLEGCETEAIAALRALPHSPFHIAAELDIADEPQDVATYFDEFIRGESRRLEIRAVYTEMNGFDINPGLWFCSPFAYIQDGGIADFDWLSDWQSEDFDHYVITGMEPLQAVYASEAFSDPAFDDARQMSDLVVVTRFQRFMQQTVKVMSELRTPLYVTAHDYDYIARIVPHDDAG